MNGIKINEVFESESSKTLANLLKTALLTTTLKEKSPFTVFAPTKSAFTSIQKDVDSLLKPENKATLARIFLYNSKASLRSHLVAHNRG